VSEIEEIEQRIQGISGTLDRARSEISRWLVGQRYMVDRLLIGLLANGHVLVEGVPGLAKTTAVRALASSMDLKFSRIQFTPDLLPADLVGTQIYQPKTGEFTTKLGPVFANVLLADEINRAPAKVQSALLEAMQERQVTLGENTYPLPNPFLVLATQNPLEQEGTYPLPEAQMDRFMMKLRVDYPSREEELEVIRRSASSPPELTPVTSSEDVIAAQALAREVKISDVLMEYIVDIVRTSRDSSGVDPDLSRCIECGASPRASMPLLRHQRPMPF
jgi:MoxR-like ATPase